MKIIFPLLTCFLFFYSKTISFSQNCKCDHTITKSNFFTSTNLKVLPGQTVCIAAGNYSEIHFTGIAGEPQAPITIRNCNGRVVVKGNNNGMLFSNCKHIRLTGETEADSTLGFKIEATSDNSMGVKIGDFSTDIELDHLEIANVGFAGIMAKSDPNCDRSNWEENFKMYNLKIHDNHIHNTGGEGIYIGSSFWNYGQKIICGKDTLLANPHLIYGLEIYRNKVNNTGAEGIQYGCSPDAKVHDNLVVNTGIAPFAVFQNNGVQIGGGSGGVFYNNIIHEVPGIGLIMIGGVGNQSIYNNLIYDTGDAGIFSDTRPKSPINTFVKIYNNTIAFTGAESLKIYSPIQLYQVVNNALLSSKPGRFINAPDRVQYWEENNYMDNVIGSAKLKNPQTGDFHLTNTSPLINKGGNVPLWELTSDLEGKPRPFDGRYDIGCYEYQQSAFFISEEKQQLVVYPNPCTEFLYFNPVYTSYQTTVLIYDTEGKLIKDSNVEAFKDNHFRLDVSSLAAGSYYLKIIIGSYFDSHKEVLFQGKFIKSL